MTYPLSPEMETSSNALVSSPLFREAVPNSISLQTVDQAPNTCLWGGCNQVFSSQQELASHVNFVHLRPSFTFQNPGGPFSLNSQDHGSTGFDYSCRWADCEQYASPGSLPGPSTGDQHDAIGILAHHLLQDHLRFPANISTPSEDKPHANQVTIIESTPTPSVPPPSSADETPADLPHDCSGTHHCRWKSCTAVFHDCDELTAHITAIHVGSGKARYHCLWGDCNRHGERGFSSKQKLCRHLQVCANDISSKDLMELMYFSCSTVPHRSPTFPMR